MKFVKYAATLVLASTLLATNVFAQDDSIIDPQLRAEINQKITELEQQSEQTVSAASFSVPDYKPAYEALHKSMTQAMLDYIDGISQIDEAIATELSHLKALQQAAGSDASGTFAELADNEMKRTYPDLNGQINNIYSKVLSELYYAGGEYAWPVRWAHCDDCYYAGYFFAVKQDGSRKTVSSYGWSRTDDTYSLDDHWWDGSLTNKGMEEGQEEIDKDYAPKLFSGCETGACVLKLKDSLAEVMSFADSLNQDIALSNLPTKTDYALGKTTGDGPLALAMFEAVNTIFASTQPNHKTYVAVQVAKALLAPAGLAMAIAAVPVAVLEKTAGEAQLVLGANYTKYQLGLKKLSSEPLDEIQNSLTTTAHAYAATLPAVQFAQ